MEHIFIECVKKHPCLWKTDMEEYKLLEVKYEAWRSIIEESSLSESGIKTVKEAKYLWKKLRDTHRQALSRKFKQGATDKKWKYEEQMDFLLPYLKRQCLDNMNSPADSDFIQEDIKIEEPDYGSDSTTPKQPRHEDSVTAYDNEHDRENTSMDIHTNITPRCLMLDDRRVTNFSARPALESFFTSMCEMTSALPEHIQIRVERNIFEVVMEAREEHLQNQMADFGP